MYVSTEFPDVEAGENRIKGKDCAVKTQTNSSIHMPVRAAAKEERRQRSKNVRMDAWGLRATPP